MDVSSEMAYPIIPLYLTAAFGATPALVGIIEGIAESTASLLKVFRGYVTDKYKKKKPIAFAGYATGFLYKLALLMSAFVKEKKEPRQTKKREKFWTGFSSLDGRLKLYLMIVFLFTLGNSSNTFLLLRAKSTGFDDTNVILLYFPYNLTASVLAVPFGKLSDRAGRTVKLITDGFASPRFECFIHKQR